MNRRGVLKLLGGGSLAAMAVFEAPLAFAQGAPLYKNAQAPIAARVADLMARMTLPEKIAQIRAAWARKADMIDELAFNPTKASDVRLAPRERNLELIREAVEVAHTADTIVLAIGDTEQTSREGFARTHLGDRTDIDIVGEQNELVDALAALGKPLIVCAINGRPPSWPNVVARADALLESWYPGQEGGIAMAEALLGRINPGAKLPVSVVRNEGQVPLFVDRKPSSRRGYLFDDASPLFPFGHGLSYTSFRKTVRFTLDDRHLATWNREMGEVVEPGPVIVSAGNSSASLKQAEFTIA